ncbi:MAG: phosphotransferase [Candidatus Moraniibacteriota bacterium]
MNEKINWLEQNRENPNLQNAVLRAIERIECEGYCLGKGKTATICALEDYPDICVKIINKETPVNNGEEEMDFLRELSEKKFPVPAPVCFAQTDKAEYVFMEIIDGLSIEDLVKGVDDKESEILKNINFNDFFRELRELVEKMHREGIHHRDLHEGNVMIDKKGKPVIIDFGTAKKIRLLEENPYIDKGIRDSVYFPSDENKIIELKKILGSYLKNKGFFNKQ